MSDKEGSKSNEIAPLSSYSEQFHELFPYYLSIGMTPEQYWDGDNSLPKDFRKAEKMRIEKENSVLWLQGMYVYEAIMDIAPILRAFAKNGTKAHPYPSKPYDIFKDSKKDKCASEKPDAGLIYMETMMANINRKFVS